MDIQAAIVSRKIHWKWCSAMMMYEMDTCDCCNNNNNNNKIYKILCVIKRNSSYINYVAYNNNTFRIHKKYCIQIYQKQENSSKGEKKSFEVVIWVKKITISNMKWSNKNPRNAELYYHIHICYLIFILKILFSSSKLKMTKVGNKLKSKAKKNEINYNECIFIRRIASYWTVIDANHINLLHIFLFFP